MLKLKGCPRCDGDMYLEVDLNGHWWNCLQCGHGINATLGGTPVPILVEAGPTIRQPEGVK